MQEAIIEAQKGKEFDEVPIGAVIVKDNKIIAKAHNKKEETKNTIWHAEMVAIDKASKKLKNWYLCGCDIYVTLEPCAMCTGALINSRIDNIYFGAYDTKGGCCGSLYNLCEDTRFNHRPNVEGGIMAETCGKMLTDFFRNKRKRKK